ncbi:PCRan1 kinase, partial [Polychytrium aggregatum]|uniref:PCRan1 kinase n=1 Tax=Polychytrium aggregatum TaxID=110093 RepID=UPI0022FE8442
MEIPPEARKRIGEVVNQYIRITDVIGCGSFAVVYLVEHIDTRERFALKCLRKLGMTQAQLETQRREANIMQILNSHDNIVAIYDIFETPEYLYLLLECCDMDLYEAITRQGGFPEDVVKEVFLQLVDALGYCHSKGIYHRDLKPENVLISRDFSIKLTDFGLSTFEPWSTEIGTFALRCGSVRYMAPECLGTNGSRGYDPASNDVWGLGVILINLLFGKNPWHEASPTDPIFSAYVGNNPHILTQQFQLTPEFDHVLRRVFDTNPATRARLGELQKMINHLDYFVEPFPV